MSFLEDLKRVGPITLDQYRRGVPTPHWRVVDDSLGITSFYYGNSSTPVFSGETKRIKAYLPLALANTGEKQRDALLGMLSPNDRVAALRILVGESATMRGEFYPVMRGTAVQVVDGVVVNGKNDVLGHLAQDALREWASNLRIEDLPPFIVAWARKSFGAGPSECKDLGWFAKSDGDTVTVTDPTGQAHVKLTREDLGVSDAASAEKPAVDATSDPWHDGDAALHKIPAPVRASARLGPLSERDGWSTQRVYNVITFRSPGGREATFPLLAVTRSLDIPIDLVPTSILGRHEAHEEHWSLEVNGDVLEITTDDKRVQSMIVTTRRELDALVRERAGIVDDAAKPDPLPPEVQFYVGYLRTGAVPRRIAEAAQSYIDAGWTFNRLESDPDRFVCTSPRGALHVVDTKRYALEYVEADVPADVMQIARKMAYGFHATPPDGCAWGIHTPDRGSVCFSLASWNGTLRCNVKPPATVTLDDIHPAAIAAAQAVVRAGAVDISDDRLDAYARSGWTVTNTREEAISFQTRCGAMATFPRADVLAWKPASGHEGADHADESVPEEGAAMDSGASQLVARSEDVASLADMATQKRASVKARTSREITLDHVPSDAIRRALELMLDDTTDPTPTEWSVTVDDEVTLVAPDGSICTASKDDIQHRYSADRESALRLKLEDVPVHALRRALQMLVGPPASLSESTWSVFKIGDDLISITNKSLARAYFTSSEIVPMYRELVGNDELLAMYDRRCAGGSVSIGKVVTARGEPVPRDVNGSFLPPHTKKESSMSEIVKTLKTDASEAAWRTAGSQFTKLAREPLVGLLSRHLGPDDDAMRGRIAAFLETELGTAMLSALLSAGLAAVPGNPGGVPERLSRELRVRAMADAGDVVADVLMGPLRQVMALYLQDVGGGGDIVISPPSHLPEGAPRIAAVPGVAVPAGERTRG